MMEQLMKLAKDLNVNVKICYDPILDGYTLSVFDLDGLNISYYINSLVYLNSKTFEDDILIEIRQKINKERKNKHVD